MKLIKNIAKQLAGNISADDDDSLKTIISDRKVIYTSLAQCDLNFKEFGARLDKLEAKNLKYHCRAYSNVAVNIVGTGASVQIPLNQTEYPQFGNMHDDTNNNNTIFIRRNGVYTCSCGVQWQPNSAGGRILVIDLIRGGATRSIAVTSISNMLAGQGQWQNVSTTYYLYEGDQVRLRVNNTSGVALDVLGTYPFSPYLSVTERMEDLDPSEYGLLDPNANTF